MIAAILWGAVGGGVALGLRWLFWTVVLELMKAERERCARIANDMAGPAVADAIRNRLEKQKRFPTVIGSRIDPRVWSKQ